MDRYELNLKIDQIKSLADKKDYQAAAAIANAIDWRKVKDWSTLATVINVQEGAGYLEEARDTAILAFNRNQGGRRLVYKLTELFIRLGQLNDAEELYKEYAHMAPHDVNRFILEYKLQKAYDADKEVLIEILEDYREQEVDEKYMFELALLYSECNMAEKCVKMCDEIAMWFPDGEYIDSALRLKSKYADITSTQQQILKKAVQKKAGTLVDEQTCEMNYKKAVKEAYFNDEISSELEDSDYAGQTKRLNHYAEEHYAEQTYQDSEVDEAYEAEVNDIMRRLGDESGEAPSLDLVEDNGGEDAQNFLKAIISKGISLKKSAEGKAAAMRAAQEQEDYEGYENPVFEERGEYDENYGEDYDEAYDERVQQEEQTTGEGIEKAKQSLNELIAKARQKLENQYSSAYQQEEEERETRTAQEIEIPVNDYNLYDTRNVQRELAENLSRLMEDEEALVGRGTQQKLAENKKKSTQRLNEVIAKAQLNSEPEDEQEQDEQIEGQMSIADWVEAVQEKKYGKRATREFSKAELERQLAEKESKEEAYDKLMKKQKEEARKSGRPFDQSAASLYANQQIVLQEVRTDLAIRVGKATARLEADVIKTREDGKLWLFAYKNRKAEEEAVASAEKGIEAFEASVQNIDADEKELYEPEQEQAPDYPAPREFADHTTALEAANENEEDGDGQYGQEYEDESDESYDLEPLDEDVTPRNVRSLFHFGRKKSKKTEEYDEEEDEYYDEPEYEESDEDEYYEDEPEEPVLEIPHKVRKFFIKYMDMDGLVEQLAEYFDVVGDEIGQSSSATGNIIISGNRSADKADLAKNIARALNQMYPQYPKKIAKTSGESINQRGIMNSMQKLRGTILLVQDAGVIVPKRIKEILAALRQDTDGMIVIFLASDSEINVLLNANPGLLESFNHRITIKQYSVNELAEYAKKYANKRQHIINDDALIVLYMKINQMNKEREYIRTDEIKEMVDCAIANAERRAARRLFGRRARRGGEYFILTEADFED